MHGNGKPITYFSEYSCTRFPPLVFYYEFFFKFKTHYQNVCTPILIMYLFFNEIIILLILFLHADSLKDLAGCCMRISLRISIYR